MAASYLSLLAEGFISGFSPPDGCLFVLLLLFLFSPYAAFMSHCPCYIFFPSLLRRESSCMAADCIQWMVMLLSSCGCAFIVFHDCFQELAGCLAVPYEYFN
ncbi:hypothetical protein Droror1_Dr00004189 [Drosera rotundifolia]